VWPWLCGAKEAQLGAQSMFYYSLLQKTISRADDIQIRKDLPREFQNHTLYKSPEPGSKEVFCKGQASMYNVFHAWSCYDRTVGYVQGMTTIGGLCLMYVTEEEAFWMLERLLNGPHQLRGIYEDGFPLAHKHLWIYDKLLARFCPKLSKFLEAQGIFSMSYAFRWFVTRFSEFPKVFVVRLFDIFLHEVMKIVFRTAIWIMRTWQKQLLAMEMDEAMVFLQRGLDREPVLLQVDEIFEAVLKVDIKTKELEKLNAEYEETKFREKQAANKQQTSSNSASKKRQ